MRELKVDIIDAEAQVLTQYALAVGQSESAVIKSLIAELPDRMPRPPVSRISYKTFG